MGQIILPSDSNYDTYMDNVRSLVSPRITEFDITNEQIDSIAYLQSIENELLSHISDAADQNHAKRTTIVEYVLSRTARKLLIFYGRSSQEAAYDESVQIDYNSFEKTLGELDSVIGRLEKTLGITETETRSRIYVGKTRSRRKSTTAVYRTGSRLT